MKIYVDTYAKLALAEHFATHILSRVREQRLFLVRDTSEHPELYPWPPPFQAFFREVQTAVRSIEDLWDRRQFVGWIRFYLDKMRKEEGTPARGRDYVKRVREHEASLIPHE